MLAPQWLQSNMGYTATWAGYISGMTGVLAVIAYTTTSLAKLYSEAIESIDPGPIEAAKAGEQGKGARIVVGAVAMPVVRE